MRKVCAPLPPHDPSRSSVALAIAATRTGRAITTITYSVLRRVPLLRGHSGTLAQAGVTSPRPRELLSGPGVATVPASDTLFGDGGVFSSPPGGESSDATDPVSWLQIAQGWSVVTSDGVSIGAVEQIEGDKQDDIFDGLAVQLPPPGQLVYVPGEQVGLIYPGQVTLKIASADADALEPFQAPPPETKWLPGKPPGRLSRWMRGGR